MIVTAACDGCDSVAVTAVRRWPVGAFGSSLIVSVLPGTGSDRASVTVGGSSSSVMVSVASDGPVTPWELDAIPDTVTCLSGASVALSFAVIVTVTVPMLAVAPAAMVSIFAALSVKSPSTAPDAATAAADTVTVVTALDARFNVAVTVDTPPDSEIDVRDSASVARGVASSSATVRVTATGCSMVRLLMAVPDTVTRLSGASVASSFAVIVTVPVLVICPAAMVSVSSALSMKSPRTAPDAATAAADTLTVTAARDVRLNVAVTVVALFAPLSLMVAGDSASTTCGTPSSSVRVSVTDAGAATPLPPVAVPETITCLLCPPTASSTAVIVTIPVLAVSPAAMVRGVVAIRLKSSAVAFVPAVAETVIVTALLDLPESRAVTLAMPPFSEIGFADGTSVTTGSTSSSARVSVASAGAAPPRVRPQPWPRPSPSCPCPARTRRCSSP